MIIQTASKKRMGRTCEGFEEDRERAQRVYQRQEHPRFLVGCA